ncbi:MAG: hypothetical protein ACLFPL_03895 [Candidatus Nanoarchaeia archaeon]
MAINFEEFLNKALEQHEEDDILDLNEENEDGNTLDEVKPISIEPLLEQIQYLKEKAISTPEQFKEVYKEFEAFEKNYPRYFLDIQTQFHEQQTILKSQYLQDLLSRENSKIEHVTQTLYALTQTIDELIMKQKFAQAFSKLSLLNYEILQIPQSRTQLKFDLLNRYQQSLQLYYKELDAHKVNLSVEIVSSIKKIFNEKHNIFSTINRTELDQLISDIQVLYLHNRIELDTRLSPYIVKLISFNSKLLEYRETIEKKCEEAFKHHFENIVSEFYKKIEEDNFYYSLVIIEMAHILLKKETKYNQNLKIETFLKLLECRKAINSMSFKNKKSFSQSELELSFAYSQLNLIKLLRKTILRYSNKEIENVITQISNLKHLSNHHKEIINTKLQLLLKMNYYSISTKKLKGDTK